MPRARDDSPAVRVYTVCDESKYLIVRNVPALGCGDELLQLFASYGEVEECKPMDAEDCEFFTDVYWIKFRQVNNARFAKRKLDEFIFLGNRLQVSYAPHYESLSETKEKLEFRRKEILDRLNTGRSSRPFHGTAAFGEHVVVAQSSTNSASRPTASDERKSEGSQHNTGSHHSLVTRVSSNKDYFSSPSMNQTVHTVREKLNKIQTSVEHLDAPPKKKRVDNRRRI